MAKRNRNRGKLTPGANPQGWGQDTEFALEPKGQLENAQKKPNNK